MTSLKTPSTKHRTPSTTQGTARPKTLSANAATTKPRNDDPSRPKARKPKARKPTTHSSLGVYKSKATFLRGDRRTLRQRAANLTLLEKTLPVLNTVVPAVAVVKRKGGSGKSGKTFLDDHDLDRMMLLVEQVSGKKQGEVESKLERARRLETIREMRRKEEEAKMVARVKKVHDTKEKAMRRRAAKSGGEEQGAGEATGAKGSRKLKKALKNKTFS